MPKYTVRVERYTKEVPEHVFIELNAQSVEQAEDLALDYAADRDDWITSTGQCRNGMIALHTKEEI